MITGAIKSQIDQIWNAFSSRSTEIEMPAPLSSRRSPG
jgi:hypothetical protein